MHHRRFRNQFPPFFPVLHCPLGLAKLQACPFPDVVFPPLPPYLVFFPLSLCFARWCWPDLINGRHIHTTAVCVPLRWSGGFRVVRLPAISLVTSIFLYACELWTPTAQLQRRMQAMEMRCYRKIVRISYKDQTPCNVLKTESDTLPENSLKRHQDVKNLRQV